MKNYYFAFVIFAGSLFLFNSCEKDDLNTDDDISIEEKYENAIKDAMIAEQSEISNKLIAINDTNSYITRTGIGTNTKILVLTWTKYPGSFPEDSTITNTWGEIWVTVVPELEDWFESNYTSGSDFILRAEQLLGLPENKGYTSFVELWVKPEDLLRPTPDNEITDNFAQLDFPANVDSNYKVWFNDNIIYSYYPMRYPWTRLGYTYDWGNSKSEIGLSEFIIRKNSQITVHDVSDNATYFNSIDN